MRHVPWSLRLVLAFTMTISMGATGCEQADAPMALNETPQKIVNGTETNYEQWQGVIGLFTGMSICTATLIAPDIALSAGHCVYYPAQGVDYVKNPGDLQILGGPIMDEFYSYATKIAKHPQWQGNLWGNAVDLSMIKLETPVKDQPYYKIRQAPSVKVGDKGWIVGYGKSWDDGKANTYEDEASAGTHRAGETTVLTVQTRVIEVGSPTSTCQGDSGGPLFTHQNGDWVITGVTSFGQGRCTATGGGWDVNVLTYRAWIESTFEQLAGYPLSEVDARWKETDPVEDDLPTVEDSDEDDVNEDPEEDPGQEKPLEDDSEDDSANNQDMTGEPLSMSTSNSCTATLAPSPTTLLGLLALLF
jgi:V8-like Glu-specific endopeptidase